MTKSAAVLEKLAGLKRHMESAKECSTEAEVEAFAAMIQRLLVKYKLDMTDIEFKQHEQDEPVKTHYIDYSKWPDVAMRKTRIRWMEDLGTLVSAAYNCRSLCHPRSSRITLVGRDTDCKVAEYLIITIIRKAEAIADKEYTRFFYECRDKGEVHLARGFRAAFLNSFVRRIGQRLDEERRKMSQEYTSTALVRVSLAQVDQFIEKTYKNGKAGALSRHRHHAEGSDRGRKAADAVNLKANALDQGRSQRELKP